MLCREQGFGAIVLTNSLDAEPYEIAERAYKMVLPEVLNVTKPQPPEAKAEWGKWLGTYQAEWGDSEVIIRGGQLQMVSIRYLDFPPAILEPTENPYEFVIKQPGNPGETARFEVDEGGQVTRLWVRNEYMLPAKAAL